MEKCIQDFFSKKKFDADKEKKNLQSQERNTNDRDKPFILWFMNK